MLLPAMTIDNIQFVINIRNFYWKLIAAIPIILILAPRFLAALLPQLGEFA